MALKFGREMRTPAIQAGLTTRRLTLREIFPSAMLLSFSEKVKFGESTVLVVDCPNATLFDTQRTRIDCQDTAHP
jgi:hypothetical protein